MKHPFLAGALLIASVVTADPSQPTPSFTNPSPQPDLILTWTKDETANKDILAAQSLTNGTPQNHPVDDTFADERPTQSRTLNEVPEPATLVAIALSATLATRLKKRRS